MHAGRNKIIAKAAVCVLLVTAATRPAAANSIPTKSDVVWIGVAVGAIGAGIGLGIYFAVHHNASLTGCAASGRTASSSKTTAIGKPMPWSVQLAQSSPVSAFASPERESRNRPGQPRSFLSSISQKISVPALRSLRRLRRMAKI